MLNGLAYGHHHFWRIYLLLTLLDLLAGREGEHKKQMLAPMKPGASNEPPTGANKEMAEAFLELAEKTREAGGRLVSGLKLGQKWVRNRLELEFGCPIEAAVCIIPSL